MRKEITLISNVSEVYIAIQSRLKKAISNIAPPSDIEDIVQEAYVRVCQVDNKKKIDYPQSFLFKTARNLALDFVKRSENRVVKRVDTEDELEMAIGAEWRDDPYDQLSSNREFAQFCEAVRDLPIQCRKVFVLKKVYGYTQREIASKLSISESTVEKHIASGIKRCAKAIAEQKLRAVPANVVKLSARKESAK